MITMSSQSNLNLSHSSDVIKIVNDNGVGVVRKEFLKNRSRSLGNIEKQQKFSRIRFDNPKIRVVSVEIDECSDASLIVNMPYIEGLCGPDYAVFATHSVGSSLSSILSSLVYNLFEKTNVELVSTKVFNDKFQSIVNSTTDSSYIHYFDLTRDYLSSLPETMRYPIGICHGDLTLSNVLYDCDGQLHLIDFLQCYIESPLQDIAKLRQDFEFGWSFRYLPTPIYAKAKIFCEKFSPKAIDVFRGTFPVQTDVITLLALLRIIPYCRDSITREWILSSLDIFFREVV